MLSKAGGLSLINRKVCVLLPSKRLVLSGFMLFLDVGHKFNFFNSSGSPSSGSNRNGNSCRIMPVADCSALIDSQLLSGLGLRDARDLGSRLN